MIARYIRTASDFRSLVIFGTTTESEVLEFKSDLDNWEKQRKGATQESQKAAKDAAQEAQKETCRDIGQFANTFGGCLLIGVAEKVGSVPDLKVAQGIKPVARPDAMKQWIEQAIFNYLVPSTFTYNIETVALPEGAVLAVNVLPSRHLVYLWDRAAGKPGMECLTRTSHGKRWMNPHEVERHIMNGSRATRIALFQAMEQAKASKNGQSPHVRVAGGLRLFKKQSPWNPSGPIEFGSVGDASFELRVPTGNSTKTVSIPYEVVRAVWPESASRVALLLEVHIALSGDGEVVLDPFD